jgi:hypothetical protein
MENSLRAWLEGSERQPSGTFFFYSFLGCVYLSFSPFPNSQRSPARLIPLSLIVGTRRFPFCFTPL